jgi:CubicO group peptidase (beta-lactamase class C family)
MKVLDMTSTLTNTARAAAPIALGVAIAAMGLYVANADDAPGAAVMGFLLMVAAVLLGVKAARSRLPIWAGRTALAAGVLLAAFAAVLTHAVTVAGPLYALSRDVPSSLGAAPSLAHAAAVERARVLVRAAILEQNLPGVSVAVGAGGRIVWAEGFGWRDVDTRTPVTPQTRFNIGTAASAVTAATVTSLGLTSTGAEPAAAWSPEAIGEPGEDFPPLTIIRHVILQPLGLAPAEYPLPGDRATFYVPRADDNPLRGRRLMYMRDLACCAGTMASYSTASDLVRAGMASERSVNGELAGGMVTSLTALPDRDIVVAVMSNIAHADTSAIAMTIADAFQTPVR